MSLFSKEPGSPRTAEQGPRDTWHGAQNPLGTLARSERSRASLAGVSAWSRGGYTHFEIGRVKHLKREMIKQQIACFGMIECSVPFFCTKHLMSRPPGPKLGAMKQQILDQLGQTGIPRIAATRGTEFR